MVNCEPDSATPLSDIGQIKTTRSDRPKCLSSWLELDRVLSLNCLNQAIKHLPKQSGSRNKFIQG